MYLIITAIVCGALIMVVEILGSRVIGPFFGVSLFVWTSLITVTLMALAAGYAVGGLISDRKRSPDYLYGIILVAGFLVLVIPIMKGVVLGACLPLGLRAGSLVSSLLLFGPSLFFLGCVSPYLVKIAAQEMRNIGRTVGIFYAVSTMGSFIGTIVTGFVLIAYFGVDRIFEVVGSLLVLLSVGYYLLFRRRWGLLVFLLLPLLSPRVEPPQIIMRPSGTKVTVVSRQDSFYGNLKVVDYSYGLIHTRELTIDGLIQGGIDVNNKMPIYADFYPLMFTPYGLNPGGKTCLVIGLGTGIIPMWYESVGIKSDVVEIDPKVLDLAREYFGFRLSGEVIIADARYYLISSPKQYDYIILDVFTGDTTPGHVLSLEALRLVKKRMTMKGIFAANLIGSLKKNTFMTASVVRTLEEVFQTVEIYPSFSHEDGEGAGNIAIVAYDTPSLTFKPERVRSFSVHPLAINTVRQFLGKQFHFPADTEAIILTDDYNPIDFYDSWLKEWVRRKILEDTNLEVLM